MGALSESHAVLKNYQCSYHNSQLSYSCGYHVRNICNLCELPNSVSSLSFILMAVLDTGNEEKFDCIQSLLIDYRLRFTTRQSSYGVLDIASIYPR